MGFSLPGPPTAADNKRLRSLRSSVRLVRARFAVLEKLFALRWKAHTAERHHQSCVLSKNVYI